MANTLTTGLVWLNPNTQNIIVNVLNVSNKSQAITVSVIDHPDCTNPELGKVAFLCGQPIAPDGFQLSPQQSDCDPLSDPTCDMEPVFTPVTFTIPSQGQLVVYAIPNPFTPPSPVFEARVTGPFSASIFPPSPCRISLFGVDAVGVPQVGNVLFHPNFVVL